MIFEPDAPLPHAEHCKCRGSGEAAAKDGTVKPCDGLTKFEARWLEHPTENDSRTRRLRRPETFANQMLLAASRCTTALRNATVEVPPPNRRQVGSRGIVGPSDPALAQVEATHHTIDMGCVRLGHVLDDCQTCDGWQLWHNSNRDITLAALTGEDYTELADHLVGISAMSPHAIGEVTAQFDTVMAKGARRVVDVWNDMNQSGAEADRLRDYVGQIVELTGRLRSVSGPLAQWLPGVQVRLCKNDGCVRPAPLRPSGVERGGGAQCRRCIDLAAQSRRPA